MTLEFAATPYGGTLLVMGLIFLVALIPLIGTKLFK